MDINYFKRIPVKGTQAYTSLIKVDTTENPDSLDPNIKPTGLSSIYTFPFRIYAKEPLNDLVGDYEDVKYKIHTPLQLLRTDTPMSPDIDMKDWPSFKWAPTIDASQLKDSNYNVLNAPSSTFGEPPKYMYDIFRLDVWSESSLHAHAQEFSYRFLNWLRVKSGQPWINSFEVHNHSHLKYEFNIDENGDCLQQPKIVRKLSRSNFVNIDNEIWKDCFNSSLLKYNSKNHLQMWYDASISLANGNIWQAAMMCILAIEVAKNMVFKMLFKHTESNGSIRFASKSLNDTDLLRLLSKDMERELKRNLEKEEPLTWNFLRDLYITRHHLAHGKNTAFRTGYSFVPLDEQYAADALTTSARTIQWIESLVPTDWGKGIKK